MFRLAQAQQAPQAPPTWEEKNAMILASWRIAHPQKICIDENCSHAQCRCRYCELVSVALASCASAQERICVSVHLLDTCPRLLDRLMKRAVDTARQRKHRCKVRKSVYSTS
jgi:hypothetical protein